MATHFRSGWTKILSAAFCVGCLAVWPQSGFGATFGEVMGWCSSPDDRLCDGYLTEAFRLLRSPDPVDNGGHRVCFPPGVTTTSVVPLLEDWGRQHPKAASVDYIEAASNALASRYPCN